MQVQKIGDPVRGGERGARHAGVRVQQLTLRRLHLHVAVVMRRDADEYPGVRAPQALRHLPAVLQRVPDHLQQQPVLRVHPPRLPRRDAEELRVETIDSIHEASPARIQLASPRRVRVVDGIEVEAPGRHLGDRIDPISEETPEPLRRIGAAREAAAQTDDGDWDAGLGLMHGPGACARGLEEGQQQRSAYPLPVQRVRQARADAEWAQYPMVPPGSTSARSMTNRPRK
jgi:hypothetical protein